METLLIEIGTEEIPAGYIEPALKAFSESLVRKLKENRIACGDAKVFGTPRRLGVMVMDTAGRQQALESEVIGPPLKVARNEKGEWTTAATKFAEKVNLPVSRLKIQQTPKGQYLCARVQEPSEKATVVLSRLLPELIEAIPFPKTMKWGSLHVRFARPIHFILAMYGKQTIGFELGDVKSQRITFGHRFMAPARIKIDDPATYLDQLARAWVIADIEKRRNMVARDVAEQAAKQKGRVIEDPELIDIVTQLVEYPTAVCGRFEKGFLELPDAVLITAMKEHQKYFAIQDAKGKLMPCFIAVNNTCAKDMDVVRNGHERVLRARLNDARFFYRADLEKPLEASIEKLKGVLFLAKLGTMYDKTLRIQRLAGTLASMSGLDAETKELVLRAAWLCKADLVTQMVVEFPKLQGTMGKVYALKSGEAKAVAQAIEEHYRPTASGGELARSLVGALVGLADKLDSICGCFSAGLAPTGASDPYALRRQAIGVLLTMKEHRLEWPLETAVNEALRQYGLQDAEIDRIRGNVMEFFETRLANILVDNGFSKDVTAAVLAVGMDSMTRLWKRAQAVEQLKKAPDYEPLSVCFKRVVNIIRKADPEETAGLDPDALTDASEIRLYRLIQKIQSRCESLCQEGKFTQALQQMVKLREPVDAFFDAVLVMAEDVTIRKNRLGLLARIAGLFAKVADFSKLS
ncbi:glycine--tRNA ligase subunit beta [Desulfatirhabdium butyrativorans]|uniref:glycine--tRNA ligase subunit beta n=1 Tax=Desulfatirhabdium butyrativorans TaxID=340467 RepID=UPI00048196FB|nr:glycine--tRNA ligase subunit beta [Desulfatirhabdium butyrativorans]